MKTDLLVLAATALLLTAAPAVSQAEHQWTPLALGEPMDDCDIHHHDIVMAIQPAPALSADKVEAILATPDVAPAVTPVAIPAATPAAVAPAKAAPGTTTRAAPRHLSPAALLSFALIASPGTALPQTNGSGRD